MRVSHWSFVATVATASMLASTTASFAGDPCTSSANDCCVAGVGPGCSDFDCCTAVCAADGFCCSVEWDSICAGVAAGLCSTCSTNCTVDCSSATAEEGEPCGEDLNGGCNDLVNGAVSLADLGDVICGNYWAEGSFRDTDWYEFTLTENKIVSFSLQGQIQSNIFLVGASCPAGVIATGIGAAGSCDPVQINDVCLVAGTYRIVVVPALFEGTPCTAEAKYLLSLIDTGNVCTAAPGDVCDDALPVVEGDNAVSTIGAFTNGDPLDPTCASFGSVTMFNDTWYTFTPATSGLYTISTCDQIDFDSRLALYSGDCSSLSLLACNDDGSGCGGFTSEMVAALDAGTEYRIRLGGFNAAESGSGTLTISQFVGCDEAACPSGGVEENEICGADLNGGCNGGVGYESIAVGTPICGNFWASGSTRDTDWYSFNLTESRTVTMTVNANIDVTIGLLDANCPPFIYAIEIQPGCGATLSFCLPAGDSVAFVAPSGFDFPPCDSGDLNNYVLTVTAGDECTPVTCGSPDAGDCCTANGTPFCNDADCCAAVCAADGFCCSVAWDALCADQATDLCAICAIDPPANDECTTAVAIFDGDTAFSTLGATDSLPALDPTCDEGFGTAFVQDIWFSYTATCDGTVTFSTCGLADFDTRLALYTDCDTFSLVACNDDGPGCPGLSSLMTAELTEGTTYLLRVGGFAADGTGTISISCGGGGGLENDECAGALPLNLGANGLSNIGATGQTVLPAECVSFTSVNINNDVWYTYTATATGLTTISTCGTANFDTRLAAFTGACDSLTFVACNDDGAGCAGFTSILTFEAVCGETYTIVAGAFGTAGFGTGTITVTQAGTCPTPCTGDLDGDGDVDAGDLAVLLGSWNNAGGPADLNGNGLVGAEDLALLLGAWGDCP
jgi:hypothetical protein